MSNPIYKLFQSQVRPLFQNVALTTARHEFSFRELNEKIDIYADALKEKFDVKSDHIIVVLINEPGKLAVTLFALLKIDCRILVANPSSPADLTLVIKEHDPQFIIADHSLNSNVDASGYSLSSMYDDAIGVYSNNTLETKDSSRTDAALPRFYLMHEYLPQTCSISDIALSETLVALDQAIQPIISDKMLITGSVAFNDLVIKILWCVSRCIHFIAQPIDDQNAIAELLPDNEVFPMDFSLFYFGSYAGNDLIHSGKYDLVLDTIRHADEHEYTAVWTPERHFDEFGGLFPNPSVLSAALAMITKNVQIRSGSIVAPLHHSVRIAEDWSLIDNLSNGRAAISFASGWQCNDFVFYPERYPIRHEHMLKQIKEVKELWKGGRLEMKNGMGQDIQVGIYPKPIQSALPVWVTVSGKIETFIDAGKIGANILTHLLWQDPSELVEKIAAYRQTLKENGFDPESRIVSVMAHTFIGDDEEEVKKIVRKPLKDYIKSSVHLIEAMTKSNQQSSQKDVIGRYGKVEEKVPEHLLEELLEIAFNRFFDHAALLGSMEKCHGTLKKLRGYGVDELACLIDFGLDGETIKKGLKKLTSFKERYDPRKIRKYKATLLSCNPDSLKKLAGSSPMRSLKKIVVSKTPNDVDEAFAGRENIIELQFDLQPVNDKSFVRQNTNHVSRLVSQYDNILEQVNANLSEEF